MSCHGRFKVANGACVQEAREDTSLMTDDDDDDDEMEDLDALATGLDRGQVAPLPKPASDTGHTSLCLCLPMHCQLVQ